MSPAVSLRLELWPGYSKFLDEVNFSSSSLPTASPSLPGWPLSALPPSVPTPLACLAWASVSVNAHLFFFSSHGPRGLTLFFPLDLSEHHLPPRTPSPAGEPLGT